MWRKIVIAFVSGFCMLSVVFAMKHTINANVSSKAVNSNITGRVNKAPAGITGNHIGLQKGDKILYGITNASNMPLAWQLISSYTTNNISTEWLTMSTTSLQKTKAFNESIGGTDPKGIAYYRNTFMKPYVDALTTQLPSLSYEASHIGNHVDTGSGADKWQKQDASALGKVFFIPTSAEISTDWGLGKQDLAFSAEYWGATLYSSYSSMWNSLCVDGTVCGKSVLDENEVRPAAIWDVNDVVFAASSSANGNVVSVQEPVLSPGYASIYEETQTDQEMQLRVYDATFTATLNAVRNKNKDELKVNNGSSGIQIGEKLYIDATITGGANVSAILFDANNHFAYYVPAMKKINGFYEVDTKNLQLGNYKLGIVSEGNVSGSSPINCSDISNLINISVVEPQTISYTKTPQPGASLGDYEYNKNVKAGQKVGTISLTSTGVTPITYELTSYDGTDTSYKNFEIAGLDATDSSSATSLDVKIKPTDNLKAGDYKFCIIARDANGDPQIPVDGKTKVCTSFTVEKTQPTIEFTSDDKGTIYVKGDVTNTLTHSESATHSNGDASSDDVGIVYSMSDPSSIIQSGLPFTSAKAGDVADIIFKANVSGTVEIQALIPESDNYKEAKTSKTIILQLGLTGSYVEDEVNITAGSTAAKPPASYSQANRIGHINVLGGNSPFVYTLPTGKGNNGSFYIDKKDGDIYVHQSVTNGLTPCTYDIEVDITDNTSPTKQTATVKKTITILPASLSGVAWLDPATGKALSGNTITVTYDPSKQGGGFNTKLLETTAGSLANTGITFTLDPSSNDAISITPSGNEVSVTVKKASDASTKDKVKIIASITGGMYGSTPVTTEVYVNVEKYTQTIAFPETTKLKLPAGSACVSVPANITSTYSIPNGVIQYTSSDTSANAPFTIDKDGKVCPTSHAGSASLTGTLLGNDNFSDAKTPVSRVIEVYEPGAIEVSGSIQAVTGASGVNYTVGTLLKAHDSIKNPNGTAKVGDQAARVEDTGSSTPSYAPSSNQGNKNADVGLFTVMPKGYITLKQDITASDIQNHGTGNIYYIQVDVTDDNGYTKTVDVEIKIADADADFYFINPISGAKLPLDHVYDDGKTKIAYYTTAYVPNGTIDIKTNLGSTYSEDTVGDSDVIDALNMGNFTILHASDPAGIYGGLGGNTYVKACMTKKPGYSDPCIYAQVEITKAEQPDFAFVQSPTWTLGKTPAIITPIYNDQLSTGDVIIQSISDTTIAEIEPPVTGSNQSFKTTGKVGTTTIKATAPADRNYNSKEAETTLNITEKPPTTLSIFVPSMTYGDTGGKAQITNGYKPGVPAYFYVDDASILTVDGNPVNAKDSPAFTANGSGQVTVKVCQTSDPFDPVTDDCNAIGGDYGELTITVKKKPLTLTYEDEEIYTGEDFPAYRFTTPTQTNFVSGDSISDFPVPANTNANKQGTAIADTKTAGIYAISGSYAAGELTGNALHYEVTIQAGELTIKQDTVLDSWYHLEDPQGNTVNKNEWHNYFVDVVLDTAKGDGGIYDQISNTNTFTNADKTRFTVNEENENLEDVYFRIDPNGNEAHKGAITSTQTTIKIDMTAPEITSITGYPVNTDGLSNLLHEITLGHFFKPGVEVTIQAIDPQPANSQNVTVSGIEKVEYKVYALDDKGVQTSQTAIDTGSGDTDINGNISFKINKIGNYRVCAAATDRAGNPAAEKCADLNIHKIDVDEDGDGELDFNDSDNDGCPDLNIVLGEDSGGNKVKLNVAEKGKKYPYMNIDSDGDGKPDLNIDTDHDGKPDLNLVILTEKDWIPSICVNKEQLTAYTQPNKYCTGTDAKAVINVVVDNGVDDVKDQTPSINIDNNGDFKPDLNISKDGKTPYLNIVKLHEWKPAHDYTKDSFFYDSIGTDKDDPKRELNIDTDEDGYPDINLDIDGDGTPDLNIDKDYDGIPDLNIDANGDGKPDFNIDISGNGFAEENIYQITEWKPNKDHNQVDGFEYDTMEIKGKSEIEDNGIIVEKPSGEFLPNSAIKVKDISDTIDTSTKEQLDKIAKDQEIKRVYDVEYLENNTSKQPDGKVNVKIPIDPLVKNAKVVIEKEDGSFEEVKVTEKDGYYVFETEYIGKVSVIGDVESTTEPEPKPTPDPEPTTTPDPEPTNPNTSVQGNYTTTTSGVGGAYTGDETVIAYYAGISMLSFCILLVIRKRINN